MHRRHEEQVREATADRRRSEQPAADQSESIARRALPAALHNDQVLRLLRVEHCLQELQSIERLELPENSLEVVGLLARDFAHQLLHQLPGSKGVLQIFLRHPAVAEREQNRNEVRDGLLVDQLEDDHQDIGYQAAQRHLQEYFE